MVLLIQFQVPLRQQTVGEAAWSARLHPCIPLVRKSEIRESDSTLGAIETRRV